MKESVIYEGELGESLHDALPVVIEKVRKSGKRAYLRWNGVTLLVGTNDTEEGLFKEYNRKLHAMSLLGMEERSELIRVDDLSEAVSKFVLSLVYNQK